MKKLNFSNTFKCLMKIGVFVLGICLIIASGGGGDGPTGSHIPQPPAPPVVTSYTPWSFGVMGDTQWTYDLDDPQGTNPETVAGSFITQINQEFINHDVEFVIEVGDLTNYGYDEAIAARATLAQGLYDAGIGFFPFRGNHEPWGDIFGDMIDNQQAIPAIQLHFPQNRGEGANTAGATNFSSPTSTDPLYPNLDTELAGISYAFDFGSEAGNDATFVIIDPWETDSLQNPLFYKDYGPLYFGPGVAWWIGYPYGYPINSQQAWISERLDLATRGTEHAFVFSHQPLIGGNHEDSPFGFLAYDPTDETYDGEDFFGSPDPVTNAPDNTGDQNTFWADLIANDVAFYICGHDHMHDRSMVDSPDGLSSVEQIIAAPACPKFYHANHEAAEWRGQKYRKTVIETEYDNSGYYIYTVEGSVVTVDYYADATGNWVAATRPNRWPAGDPNETELITPDFDFVKKSTWRFGLNQQAFMVAQGADYSVVSGTYNGTTASLMGVNTSTSIEDPNGDATAQVNPLTKRITTTWKDQTTEVLSGIVMLDGMTEVGQERADPFVFILTDASVVPTSKLVAQNEAGDWVNAATLVAGGIGGSVAGPPSTMYDVGTYGVDIATDTVWAVIDYDNGTFGVSLE